jgi:hypothetical protein
MAEIGQDGIAQAGREQRYVVVGAEPYQLLEFSTRLRRAAQLAGERIFAI